MIFDAGSLPAVRPATPTATHTTLTESCEWAVAPAMSSAASNAARLRRRSAATPVAIMRVAAIAIPSRMRRLRFTEVWAST
jgi:hypothetical protein